MAAPKGNSNRAGKSGQKYNLSYPKLVCGTCKARDWCPVASDKPDTPCLIMKRMRKIKLDTLEDIRELRKYMLMQNLIQLEVMSIHTEKNGVSSKEMIAFRKNTMAELADLEKDTFNQQRKRKADNPGTPFVLQLIQESQKPLPQETILEAEHVVEENPDAAGTRALSPGDTGPFE